MQKLIYLTSINLQKHSADVLGTMEMCNAFSKNGFDLKLIVPGNDIQKDFLFKYYGVEYAFDIIPIKIPKIFLYKYIPGRITIFSLLLYNKLKKLKYQIAYTRTTWVFFIITVLYNRQCYFEAHQFRYFGVLQTWIYRALVKTSVKSGNGTIVCISNSLKNQWKKYGIDDQKMHVAHDAVNVNKFNTALSISEARKQIGIGNGKSIVAYTGRLIPGKGVEILIQCANRLNDINFIIVGGEKDQIKQLSKYVEHENVIFVGHIPHHKIPIYQSAADILALPNSKGSLIDDVTSPLKLFEYLASKRPIVATNIPSLLEILRHEYNALISPAGNVSKLSENIELLVNNPDLRHRLSHQADQDLQKYTWDSRCMYLTKIFNYRSSNN